MAIDEHERAQPLLARIPDLVHRCSPIIPMPTSLVIDARYVMDDVLGGQSHQRVANPLLANSSRLLVAITEAVDQKNSIGVGGDYPLDSNRCHFHCGHRGSPQRQVPELGAMSEQSVQ